jgi:hypothetical protein
VVEVLVQFSSNFDYWIWILDDHVILNAQVLISAAFYRVMLNDHDVALLLSFLC